jgi:hypothetical protein
MNEKLNLLVNIMLVCIMLMVLVFMAGCNPHSVDGNTIACARRGLGYWANSDPMGDLVSCYNISTKQIVEINYKCLDYSEPPPTTCCEGGCRV